MPAIRINLDAILNSSADLEKASRTLSNVKNSISSIRDRIPNSVLARNGISQSFQAVINSTSGMTEKTEQLIRVSTDSVNRYNATEVNIAQMCNEYGRMVPKQRGNSINQVAFHETKSSKESKLKSDIDIWSYIGKGVKKAASSVRSYVGNTVFAIKNSYTEKGTIYKIAQYGKATFKAAKGVVKIGAGVGSLFASGGMSAPVALLSIMSGANDFYNSINDAASAYAEQYDRIGENYLKSRLEEGGEMLGDLVNSKEIGKRIGSGIYFGIDLVTSLESLGVAWDKVVQADSVSIKGLGDKFSSMIGDIFNTNIHDLLCTDLETLKYQAKLFKYTYKELFGVVDNAEKVIDAGKSAFSLGKVASSLFFGEEIAQSASNDMAPLETAFSVYDTLKDFDGVVGSDLIGNVKRADTFTKRIGDDVFLSKDISNIKKDLKAYENFISNAKALINQ